MHARLHAKKCRRVLPMNSYDEFQSATVRKTTQRVISSFSLDMKICSVSTGLENKKREMLLDSHCNHIHKPHVGTEMGKSAGNKECAGREDNRAAVHQSLVHVLFPRTL